MSGIRSSRPGVIDAKFLAGPSGVGKTETVYTIAELLAGGDPKAREKVIKLNGGEYQTEQRQNLARLLGAPPGYIGSAESAKPAEVIFSKENLDKHRIFYKDRNGQQRSVILILVDEAEKADRSFHNAFLSILDKGELDLANNTRASFEDAVIFYTSNIGNDKVEQLHEGREQERQGVLSEEDRELIRNEFFRVFPPEFRGRIQEAIFFNHLSPEAIKRIAEMKLKEVASAFAESKINVAINLTPEALDWLVEHGYSRSEGARGMEKLIKKTIMDPLIIFDTKRDVDFLPNGINLKRTILDVSENGEGLEFYFGSGNQLVDSGDQQAVYSPRVSPRSAGKSSEKQTQLSSLPQQSKLSAEDTGKKILRDVPLVVKQKVLIALHTGSFNDLIATIRVMEREGVLAGLSLTRSDIYSQADIREAATNKVVDAFREGGIESYKAERDNALSAGFGKDIQDWGNVSAIRTIAKVQLFQALERDNKDPHSNFFEKALDQVTEIGGIGDREQWFNDLFYSKGKG